ncbi:PAS domain S-box protein [Sedimenticola sp.]|uniref:PAS domain S-box protein n=1 Tax=Sedimenticola sp. TaxID=1940285 RepID=UPI003D0B903F
MHLPSLTLEQYRDIIETTLDGVWFLDGEGKTLFVNQHVADMLGYSQQEMAGRRLLDYIDSTSRSKIDLCLARSQKGHKGECELRFRCKDKTALWALFISSPLHEQGVLAGSVNLLIDITERKLLEQAAQVSEELYRRIFNSAGVGILEQDVAKLLQWIGTLDSQDIRHPEQLFKRHPELVSAAAGHIVISRANTAAIQMFDADGESALLGPFTHLLTGESYAPFTQGLIEFIQGRQLIEMELPLLRSNGQTFRAQLRVQVSADKQAPLLVTVMDITKHFMLEEALRHSEERFRDFAESAADWFWEMGPDLRFSYLSGRVYEVLGMQPEDLIGKTRKEAHSDQSHIDEPWRDHLDRLEAHEPVISIELNWRRPDGEERIIRLQGRARIDKEGVFRGYRGVGTDLTGVKAIEQDRLKEAAFRHAVIEKAAEGLCVCHPIADAPYMQFTLWNSRMAEITGYTRQQINQNGCYQLLYPDPEIQARVAQRLERMRQGDDLRGEEWEIIRADGAHRVISISTSVLPSEEETPRVLALIQDVTEKRQQQDAVLEIAKGVSTVTGEGFYHSLLAHLTPALGGCFAFIGLVDQHETDRVETLAVFSADQVVENFSYRLAGTPCADVLSDHYCIYPEHVVELFPDDPGLVMRRAQGYAGAPLVDSHGLSQGLLVVLFRTPIDKPRYVESILRIFATRISAELERQQTEKRIRDERKRVQDFAEIASDWFWEMGPDLKFSYFSERITETLGVSVDSLLGKTRQDLLVKEYDKEQWDAHLQLIEQHQPFRDFEYVVEKPDGTQAYIRISGKPLFGAEGEFLGYRGIGRNLTEEVESKTAERRLQDRLHDAMESVPGGVILFDKDDRMILCNSAYRRAVREISPILQPGITFRELNISLVKVGLVDTEGLGMDAWLEKRERLHKQHRPFVLRVKDNRWIEVLEFATKERGTLILRMDITERMQTQKALKESESRYRALIEQAADGLIVTDERGVITDCNRSAQVMLGQRVDRLLNRSLIDFIEPSERAKYLQQYNDIHRRGSMLIQCRMQSRDGRVVPVEVSARSLPDGGIQSLIRDISERLSSEERLRLSATVFESTREGVIITDRNGLITAVNTAFTEITGYTEEEVSGRTPGILNSGRHDDAFYKEMWESVNEVGYWRGEIWNRRKNGEIFPEWETISTVRNEQGELTNYVAVFSDISDIKESENQLEYLAHHDPLTELPNRLLFTARLDHALERARRDGSYIAVLFIDLDLFKNINDSLGHPVGDTLLQQVARRIKQQLRDEDTVARLGGDEFTVLLEQLANPQKAGNIADKLTQCFVTPFEIESRSLHVTASIGISIFPSDGDNTATLLRNADTAMYQAKAMGRNGFQYYVEEMTSSAVKRVLLENSLRQALNLNQFVIYYQPKLSLVDDSLIGSEALVRWVHPEMGLMPPDSFIPLAEDTGLIVSIGAWVLNTACCQIKQWQDAGLETGTVAVNLSVQQLQRGDLIKTVKQALAHSGIAAEFLELEITESFIMDEAEKAIEVLSELRTLGVTLSIDDFGTGYSSLSYLKQLPINNLKIDKSFVRDIPQDPNDEAIARAIIALAANLQLDVIAEGIETKEQLAFLRREGCGLGQGYLFSPPIPADDFEAYLRHRKRLMQASS